MSIRYVFNRNLNLKCIWVKYLVRRKICRHLGIQSLKYDICPNVRCSNLLVADNCLLHNTNTTTTVFPSWKWLLAISLLYAGYDSESELKIIIIIAFAILNHFILLILPKIDKCSIHFVNKMLKINFMWP